MEVFLEAVRFAMVPALRAANMKTCVEKESSAYLEILAVKTKTPAADPPRMCSKKIPGSFVTAARLVLSLLRCCYCTRLKDE